MMPERKKIEPGIFSCVHRILRKPWFAVSLGFFFLFFFGCLESPFGPGNQGGLSELLNFGKTYDRPEILYFPQAARSGILKLIKNARIEIDSLEQSNEDAPYESWLEDYRLDFLADTLLVRLQVGPRIQPNPKIALTGSYAIKFAYDTLPPESITTLSAAHIGAMYSLWFSGRQTRSQGWYRKSGQVDSLSIQVNFLPPSAGSKPGNVSVWKRNISSRISLGSGDTAFYTLDSLNNSSKTQSGIGSFFEANGGADGYGASQLSYFTIQMQHLNKSNPGNPYGSYHNNEATAWFAMPWGKSADSVEVEILFLPGNLRSGNIKVKATGAMLASFTFDELTGEGEDFFYTPDGQKTRF